VKGVKATADKLICPWG